MEEFRLYDLVWAIEYCCQVADAIANSVDTTDYGLNSNEDYNRYINKLYDLYDIAASNNAVTQVIEELQSDNIDPSLFIEIKEENEYITESESQEELAMSVQVGDYVKLRDGRRLYVCSRDGRSLWVTDNVADRANPYARGWSADLYDIVEIIERYENN